MKKPNRKSKYVPRTKLEKLLFKRNAVGFPISWWSRTVAKDCSYAYDQLVRQKVRLVGAGQINDHTVRGLILHKGMEVWGKKQDFELAKVGVADELKQP